MRFLVLFKRHWFGICLFLILLISIFFRFYNYENRWGLGYDQAHDVLVAKYALENYKIPLLGPFSSAGPFQTGGEWYWLIMASIFFFPYAVIAPWVVMTILYVVFVLLITLLGKEMLGKNIGLLIGLFAAVSTSQIAQSVNLTNQSPLAIVSLLLIWFMVKYVKNKKNIYLFLMGVTSSVGATIHLQGSTLYFVVLLTIIFTGIPSKKGFVSLLSGLFIPLLPLLIFDLKTGFVNLGNMFNYYLFNENIISYEQLGRRWLTYLGVFWPNSLSHILGGSIFVSILTSILFIFAVIYSFFKKTLSKEWIILIISFFSFVILLRYIRTPLFDSYLVFLHPFVFLLLGWTVYIVSKKKLIFGFLLSTVFIAGSISKDFAEINVMGNFSDREARDQVEKLSKIYPEEKFSVYSYQYKWADKNLILGMYLYFDNKIDDMGKKIGIAVATRSGVFDHHIIHENGPYKLFDLDGSSSAELVKSGWGRVNPSDVYMSTQEWYSKK